MQQATKSSYSFAGMPQQKAGEANGELSVDQRRVTQLEHELEKLKAENRELRVQVQMQLLPACNWLRRRYLSVCGHQADHLLPCLQAATRGGQLRHYGKLSKVSFFAGDVPPEHPEQPDFLGCIHTKHLPVADAWPVLGRLHSSSGKLAP